MVPALEQIYKDLGYVSEGESFAPASASPYEDGVWIEFDQTEFIKFDGKFDPAVGLLEQTEFGETGRAYIPNSCNTETCRVHVALHGC